MNTAPDSSAGKNPGDFSSASLKSGKRRVQQGCAGILPWECCWVPTEGTGVLQLIAEVLLESRRGRSIPQLWEALPTRSLCWRSPGSPSRCHLDDHVQPSHPHPRNVPLCGSSMGNPGGPARMDPAGMAAKLFHGSSVPLGTGKGSGPAASLQGHTQHSQLILIHPGSPAPPELRDTASSQIQHIPAWCTGTQLGKGEVNPCPESLLIPGTAGIGEILKPNFRVSQPSGGCCCSRKPRAPSHSTVGLFPGIGLPPPLLKITHIL